VFFRHGKGSQEALLLFAHGDRWHALPVSGPAAADLKGRSWRLSFLLLLRRSSLSYVAFAGDHSGRTRRGAVGYHSFSGVYGSLQRLPQHDFQFAGDYRDTLRTVYWLGLIPIVAVGTAYQTGMTIESGKAAVITGIAVIVLGILFPWWLARLRTFLVNKTVFGGVKANVDITGGKLWGIYFRGGLLIAVGGPWARRVRGSCRALKLTPYTAVCWC